MQKRNAKTKGKKNAKKITKSRASNNKLCIRSLLIDFK